MSLNFHLIDGPLLKASAQREALVQQMADDLVRYDAFANESDAIRTLMNRSYRPLDIALLADDARQVAMQSVVAREMSRS